MQIRIYANSEELGAAAAAEGAKAIRQALKERGTARIILATGASQFDMLAALVSERGISWPDVECFHLDEYVGIPATHPASFRRYLQERFVSRLPEGVKSFRFLDTERPLDELRREVGEAVAAAPIDVAFIGIGENAHLAFNDPPADFETEEPYLVVELDEACRRQQQGEGWFPKLENVPTQAVSMSVRQILKANKIVCSVPDERKARAVRESLEEPVDPKIPASILRTHDDVTLFLDRESASQLAPETIDAARKSS
ncbi:MAG TPA: glucosamine-6-phosphate deaminase [Pirellulaceae bacterium]|nr:glucosamine-6-phosphate deaminase [Pirellulaceae bacterium]